MTDLTGKTALVTGGGSGVGAAIALAYANAGAKVWISGRSKERLNSVADQHKAISSVVADVTDEASVQAMYEECGPCDIIVANAGAADSAPFVKTELEDWNGLIAVNLTGVFLTFRDGLRQMPKGGGRLIAISSIVGLKGYAYVAPYAATKHGVIGIVRALAKEVAKAGITVNAICPGYLDTPMTDRTIENIMSKTGMSQKNALDALTTHNPQGQLISPDEVAGTALWLCGENARSVNGQAIALSGGEV